MAEPEKSKSTDVLSQQSEEKDTLEKLLEPQERLFCYEYIVDFNHRRAAQKVGRSPDAGIRLLRNPNIARYIKTLSDELAQESLITRDMVQYEILNDYLPMAKGEKPISGVDRDGVEWTAKVTNMAAYKGALDLMSKHSGFTVPEVVQGGLTINVDLRAMGITVDGDYEDVSEDGA